MMTRRSEQRHSILRDMAASLHRAELREKNVDGAPSFARLPEWSQNAYIARADAALRVVQSRFGLTFSDGVREDGK